MCDVSPLRIKTQEQWLRSTPMASAVSRGVKYPVQDVLNTYIPSSVRIQNQTTGDYPRRNIAANRGLKDQTSMLTTLYHENYHTNYSLKDIQHKGVLKKDLSDDIHSDAILSPHRNLTMDWEYFQDLEQWVSTAPSLCTDAMQDFGTDELSAHSPLNAGQSELDHLSNTSTPIPDEQVEAATSWSRSRSPLMFCAPSPISESPILDTNMNTAQSLFTTVAISDDIGHTYSTQCNINDNLLVNGIINSKNMQDFNEDITSSIIAYDNLDIVDEGSDNSNIWHKFGMKSSDNSALFSKHEQPSNVTNASNLWTTNESCTPATTPIYTDLSKNSAGSPDSYLEDSSENNLLSDLIALNRPQSLHFDNIPLNETTALNTPDVINTVLSLKKDNDQVFDLLAFINEDYETKPEDDSQLQPLSLLEDKSLKRSRRSKNHTDEPFIKRSKLDSISSPGSVASTSSSSVIRRGRPPKTRTNSISSEDTDGSKYRELRDKNNEASRRSRINRKLREAQIEQEAKDLEKENIRLTVRVKELDQLVSRMREALLNNVLKK